MEEKETIGKGSRILAEKISADNDTRKTGLNNNDLIIGPSGSGKSRGYVLPNILQCCGSMVIADSKNSLYRKTGDFLQEEGYKVMNVDFRDCMKSCGYNPLDFIRYDRKRKCYNEQDILTLAACLVPVESQREPFWDFAARMFLECLVGYVLECLPKGEHTLMSVERLFRTMDGGIFRKLMEELRELAPESFAFRRWELFRATAGADRMYSSILGILAEKLSVLSFDGLGEMARKKGRIRMGKIGKEKTAVFVNVSDTDRAFDRPAALFFTQALQVLCAEADMNADGRLEMPVRFLFDDFAAGAHIPDFDKVISVIRSREISASVILQSISQLEFLYGVERAKTILNNCDTCLYLGGQDVQTAGYIAAKADKPLSAVLNMPLNQAWLFIRGQKPTLVGRYDLKSHESYLRIKGEG